MLNFKVPYGLNKEGQLIAAKDALKGDRYTCINCSSDLIFKSGEVRIKHFSHAPFSNCNPETVSHIIAKDLLEKVIKANVSGDLEIPMMNRCNCCDKEFTINIPPGTFSQVGKEVFVSGYICDVLAYRHDKESLGIEVFKTHKVDDSKGNNLPIPWIELKADDVIENPYEWNPVNSRLKPVICGTCKIKNEHIIKIAGKWGIQSNMFTTYKKPGIKSFVAEVIKCFSCSIEIPVFWWEGVPFSKVKPPAPTPHTIMFKYSKKFGGSYFMNTCPNCKVAQGDNFLFLFPNAPFNGMPIRMGSHEQLASFQSGSNLPGFLRKFGMI